MKILREGFGAQTIKCHICGSIIEYEDKDVFKITKIENELILYELIKVERTYKCVKCPVCNEKLRLDIVKSRVL